MLDVQIDTEKNIVLVHPQGPLSAADFRAATEMIDPYLEKVGPLAGLIIHSKDFPGWDSFAALCSHLRFVKDHHSKVKKVAIVTDSIFGDLGEKLATHFVSAEIKSFPFDKLEEAKTWIGG